MAPCVKGKEIMSKLCTIENNLNTGLDLEVEIHFNNVHSCL